MSTEQVPCAHAPIGIVTNCHGMGCWEHGCAVAATKAAPPVLLDDLTVEGTWPAHCARCAVARTEHPDWTPEEIAEIHEINSHERRQRGDSLPEWLAELSHRAGTKASDFFDESDYEQGRYHQGMCDAFAYAAAEARKRLEM